MPTLPYDASRSALYHPEQAASVFGTANPSNEMALAVEAARLAYVRYEETQQNLDHLTRALASAGYGPPALFVHPGSDGEGFGALSNDGVALVAFRGTQIDSICDLITIAGIPLVDWSLAPGRVHSRFGQTAIGLWPKVEKWLNGPAKGRNRLIICGHSLGAAIAALLATPAGADHLVTLGSPRIGDHSFAAGVEANNHLKATRIVNCCDVVTEVPPELMDFKHVGDLVFIDRTGKPTPGATTEFIESDRAEARSLYLAQQTFRFGTVALRDMADHSPINYVRAFW